MDGEGTIFPLCATPPSLDFNFLCNPGGGAGGPTVGIRIPTIKVRAKCGRDENNMDGEGKIFPFPCVPRPQPDFYFACNAGGGAGGQTGSRGGWSLDAKKKVNFFVNSFLTHTRVKKKTG